MSFKDELDARVAKVNDLLEGVLKIDAGLAEPLMEAMRYSVFSPGKRLRPIIMEETAALFDRDAKELPYFMAALELIHSYSLVHDDMPCMDNDEFRRGRKTTHAEYGEDIALLAGDGLLNFAYETAAAAFNNTDDYNRVARCMQVLTRKAGIFGMVGGQSVDVLSTKAGSLSESELLYMHKKKTGALIEAAMMIGGILGGATRDEIEDLKSAAKNIGLAFQIRDDILDVEGEFEKLGKAVHSDSVRNMDTYVTIYGMDKAKADVKAYSDAAMTQPVGTIPAGTSVLVRSRDGFADLYVDGKVVYISASALLNRDVTSDYAASLGKGVRVYQQASTSADSIKLPKEVTVNICAVNGDWALVQTTNKAGIYGYVRVDRLSDIHLK